jgi:hypothetical protein
MSEVSDFDPINFGPNYDAVAEVVAFAEEGALLQPVAPERRVGIAVSDLDEAKRLAWDPVFGDDELTWTDMREHALGPVGAEKHNLSWHNLKGAEFQRMYEAFHGVVVRRVPPRFADLYNDIAADLYNIAWSRAVLKQHWFFEAQFNVYKSGGWPCGWAGKIDVFDSLNRPDDPPPDAPLMAFYP